MSHDKDNLASGRLGKPRPDSVTAAAGRRAKTNYGFGRLGIKPEGSDPPAPAPPPEPPAAPAPAKGEKDPPAAAPRRPGQTVSRAEIARILEPDRAALTASIPAGRRQGGYSEDPHFGPGPRNADRGRKRALAVAVGGGALAVLLIVAFWKSHDGSAPAAARADAPPVVQTTQVPPVPPPPVRPTGPDTRHLAARPRREARHTPTPPQDDGGTPWMPPEPDRRPSNADRIPDRFRRPPAPSGFVPQPAPRPVRAAATPAPATPATPPPAIQPAIVTPTGIEVTAVLRGFGTPSAIINNRHVKVGETIEGAKLLHIGEFAVEVEYKGQTFEIAVTSAAPPPPPPDDQDDEQDQPEE